MSHEDTQRELERHALRNVRGLVDKMESIDERDKHTQRKLLAWVVAGVIAVVCVVAFVIWRAGSGSDHKPVVIDPAKLPKIQPGPSR